MKIINYIKSKVKSYTSYKATLNNIKNRISDLQRWEKETSLFDDWNDRTKVMSKYIKENETVLEFGAAKLVLKSYLPEGVVYTPSDIVDRGFGTIVCDINKKDYPKVKKQDVIFLSGVLEYVYDLPHFINYISKMANRVVVSYCTFDAFSNKKNRTFNGWVNDYSNTDFINLFINNKFKLKESLTWRRQTIYVFEQK